VGVIIWEFGTTRHSSSTCDKFYIYIVVIFNPVSLTVQDEIRSIKLELAERYYNGVCFVCGEDRGKTRGKKSKVMGGSMTFHHKKYIVNDVVHSNYPKTSIGTLQYYKDLAPLIRKNPRRFLYLCSPHHQAVERLLRYGDSTYKALLTCVKMSKQ